MVVMSKGFVPLSWTPLQDNHSTKQEMTVLPSFLLRRSTGMSSGTPPPLPLVPSGPSFSSSSASFPVLAALLEGKEGLTVVF